MKISQAGIDLIKKAERCKLSAYQDSIGVWTIGYGHTQGVIKGDTCTQEQAEKWLGDDIDAICYDCIDAWVDVDLTQNQFDALCSFIFNLGCKAFKGSSLLMLLNNGQSDVAAKQFLRWNHAGGQVISGLTTRRDEERKVFLGIA